MTGESLIVKLKEDCAHLTDAPEVERRTLGNVGLLVCELTASAATHADVSAAVAQHRADCRDSWDGSERRGRAPAERGRVAVDRSITGGIAAVIGAILTWLAGVIWQGSTDDRSHVASSPQGQVARP